MKRFSVTVKPFLRNIQSIGVVLGLLFGARAWAASDGFALVAQAMQTKATGTYQGRQTIIWTLPVSQGSSMMEIVTTAAHQGLRSRLTYLFPPDAAGRVMTDDGTQTSLYEPHRRGLMIGPSVLREENANRQAMLGLMRRNYTCTVVRRERLNGRSCAVVAICPRLQDGPYKLCWVDRAHPFVVRMEEYDRTGCRRYVSSYDSISFPSSLPGSLLSLPPTAQNASRRVVHESLSAASSPAPASLWKQAGFTGRMPAWLPRGYALLHISLLKPPSPAQALVQMRYSNGLQTLTIIESKILPGTTPSLLNGALGRYGQQAWVTDCRGVQIMVRGDLSLPTEIGAEMSLALASETEQRLARAFEHQFGAAANEQRTVLRQAGWDYTGIVSAALFLRQHPHLSASFHALLRKQKMWPAVARTLRADTDTLDTQARTWIGSTW